MRLTEEQLTTRLAGSRKYRRLGDETLRRMAAWALARYPNGEAEKAAKRKLHQVYGAYLHADLPHWSADWGYPELMAALRTHASTAERMHLLDGFFASIWQRTDVPESVLDIACGLNPLSRPWMSLPAGTDYLGVDIDSGVTALINHISEHFGWSTHAVQHDVLCRPVDYRADVALVLKTLPCLEQQQSGAAVDLLRSLRCPWVVVSFPTRTLGGRGVGMEAHYRQFMNGCLDTLGWDADSWLSGDELLYALNTRQEPDAEDASPVGRADG